MRTYIIEIKPTSGFGDMIKGDTLFGHICWQIFYDNQILGKSLNSLLADYETDPFLIVSSAYPVRDGKVYLKRPSLPLSMLFNLPDEEIVFKRKELKRRNYFSFEKPLKPLRQINYETVSFFTEQEQTRTTINRVQNTTGKPPFGPYPVNKIFFTCNLALFVGLREDIEINSFLEVLSRIGKSGYGKDSSAGFGKFEVISYRALSLTEGSKGYNALYTLSPHCPSAEETEKLYFNPFIRFGRHGDILAKSKNPFKNPIIFADEAAVVFPRIDIQRPYVGKALKDISISLPQAVAQGYSLVIRVEV